MRYQSADLVLRTRDSNDSLSLDEMKRSLPAIFAEQPHASRSDKYVYISTADTVNALMAEGFAPVEARVSRSKSDSRQAFAKHMVRFQMRGNVKARKVGDVSFEVILRNAHDGTSCYDFMAGLFRLACLNGMVVSAGDFGTVHVRHAGNRDKLLTSVVEGAHSVLKAAPIALEAPAKWSGIELSTDEQIKFARKARVVRFGDAHGDVRSPITAGQLLMPRRAADIGNDLWKTFNRVQENAIRGGLTAQSKGGLIPMHQTTREIVGIDSNIKVNKALWLLAENTARAKTGEKLLAA